MANLINGLQNPSIPDRAYSLDTLEHLNHPQCLCGFQGKGTTPKTTDKRLTQRAKNKYFTNQLAGRLAELDTPLRRAYNRTRYDCSTLIVQEGSKLTSRYCGARWCNICNRIRTAKLLNGYEQPLSKFKEPLFVTLTIPNVTASELHHTLVGMVRTSSNIIRTINRNYNINFTGIRKLESTYNVIWDTYHPHLHFIVDGNMAAYKLLHEWLKRYSSANPDAQDIQPIVGENGYKELFKYTTKIVTYSKPDQKHYIYASALDTIFQAMKGMRTFQTFGNIKKVSEDIDNIQSDTYPTIPFYESVVWAYEGNDWRNMLDGSKLTNYKPSKGMIELTTHRIIS